MSNNLFPIFLKLDQLNTLIVGGGNVALEKVSAILRNTPNAQVSMVATFFRADTLTYLANFPGVVYEAREFSVRDLVGRDLIICATDNVGLHQKIKALAVEQHILCNVADAPSLCDFYLGSIVQKGDLKIAISTNGKSPTLAKRLKVFLDDIIPADIQQSMDGLEAFRKSIKGDFEAKIKALNKITKGLTFKK